MVLNPATDPEGRKEPTLTLDGWRSFVGSSPTFTLLPMTAWQALSPSARAAYDDARVNYHSDMVIVATSTVEQVTKQGRLLTLLNRNETGARRGMIVSGPQTSGKTTAIKELDAPMSFASAAATRPGPHPGRLCHNAPEGLAQATDH